MTYAKLMQQQEKETPFAILIWEGADLYQTQETPAILKI